MTRFLKILLAPVCSVALLVSCESEKMATVSSQEAAIDNYVKGSLKDCPVFYYDSGLRAVTVEGDSHTVIAPGDQVTAGIEGHIFSNGPGAVFVSDTLNFTAGTGRFMKGLDNGFIGAARGEVSYVILTTQYGFYDEIVGIVPAMSPLLYKIEIFDIVK